MGVSGGERSMEELFELMITKEKDDGKAMVRLGIRLKIAGNEVLCPVSRLCDSYETFEKEFQTLNDALEQIEQKARRLFKSQSSSAGLRIGPETPAKDIWDILSAIDDEEVLTENFNDLLESQRQAVAEYVLTHCNIFSGKAAAFSRRYDSETGLMA